MIEEHLKNRVEQYSHSNSFGINFGSTLSFGMTPVLMNGMMAVPVDRKSTSSSVNESYAQSGMYIKENHIKIGEKIEIKPELENHEYLKVRDTSIINHIGGIASGVQEIKENWEAIQKPHHHDIIIDAEPVDVVQEHKEEKTPVIAVDVEPKTSGRQDVFTLRQDKSHEIVNKIYDADIAQCYDFEKEADLRELRPEPAFFKETSDYLEIARDFVRTVSETALEFGAEFVTPGGVENYKKFKAGEISSLEYTNLVAQDMAKDATAAAIGAQIGGGLGGAAGFAMAGGGSIPGAVAGSTAGAAIGTAISRAGTAISRTLNKEKHDSTILMNENYSKSAGESRTEKVVDREAQRKVGNVGSYGELTRNVDSRGFFDGKQAHHIPSKNFMAKYGVKEKDGLSIMMTNEQHAKTRTFKGKAKNIPADATAREELAMDLNDVRRIMKEDGTYTKEVNRNLISGVKDFKEKFPDVFKKEQK